MRLIMPILAISIGTSALVADETVTSFDNGTEGWSISGRTDIDAAGGNPGANMHGILIDVFGADIRNNSNADYLGDLSRYGTSIEISIDMKTNSLDFFGTQVPRELVVDLRDFSNDNGFPWTSVWFSLGTIGVDFNSEWTTYSVIVENTDDTSMPAGWAGYGAETNLGEPILPDGRTFASVLASVDEFAITTFVPGFFFGFTNFDIQIDNITIRSIGAPCPADLTGDGELNFFDVSAFLSAFASMDPAADFTGDGAFNFFDVSAFLAAFADGCP
jgi:hypothetical protein